MRERRDLTRQRFAKLFVLVFEGMDDRHNSRYRCICDCGNEKVVRGDSLTSGNTRSCGCLWKPTKLRHGHKTTTKTSPTYSTWKAMRGRCRHPNSVSWKWYGAKGVKVCDRWNNFEHFLADMGERPPNTTLDRIDPLGNYEPGNCRWATLSEQSKNTRKNALRKLAENL